MVGYTVVVMVELTSEVVPVIGLKPIREPIVVIVCVIAVRGAVVVSVCIRHAAATDAWARLTWIGVTSVSRIAGRWKASMSR